MCSRRERDLWGAIPRPQMRRPSAMVRRRLYGRILPELPKGCQRERIQASGELSFNVFRKAASIAEAAWQREVITKYGERFQDLKYAACKNVLCVKGAVSGTERCTISAFPCASDMGEPARAQVEHLAALDDQNLSREDCRRAERARGTERGRPGGEEGRAREEEEIRREEVREERRDEREDRENRFCGQRSQPARGS